MTHSPAPDPNALAAVLRLWALALVVWLAELLGEGPLGDALRRWCMRQLDRAEHGARAIAVLAALALLPPPPPLLWRAVARPASAPPGFAHVGVRGDDMRRVTRHLFPRERNVLARARRLDAFLDALDAHARRLARRIARIVPAGRLVAIAPRAVAVAGVATAAAHAWDSS